MAGRLFPAGGQKSIPLPRSVMYLGRSPDCDIRLDYPIVSGRHCVFVFDGTNWTVQDLRSRNGTRVNEVWIDNSVILNTGDTITIAARFRFVIEFDIVIERQRFIAMSDAERKDIMRGDDRTWAEHGPATRRLEPHDKDVWSQFEQ